MKPIFLLGYMGCGKTYIAEKLSANIGYIHIDLDQYIEQKEKKTIVELFEEYGENYFRELEHKYLLETAQYENVVISLGGGTPCYYDNMQIINNKGISFYLKIEVNILAQRITTDVKRRPLIEQQSITSLTEFIKNHLVQREVFYNQAHYKIEESGTANVVNQILLHLYSL